MGGFGKVVPDDPHAGSTRDGLVFVHHSSIHGADHLVEGQRVKFASQGGKATKVIPENLSPSNSAAQLPHSFGRRQTPRGYSPRGYDRRTPSRYSSNGVSRRDRREPRGRPNPWSQPQYRRGYHNQMSHGRGRGYPMNYHYPRGDATQPHYFAQPPRGNPPHWSNHYQQVRGHPSGYYPR